MKEIQYLDSSWVSKEMMDSWSQALSEESLIIILFLLIFYFFLFETKKICKMEIKSKDIIWSSHFRWCMNQTFPFLNIKFIITIFSQYIKL